MASVENDLLNGVASVISNLGLSVNGNNLNVKTGKIPKAEEGVDTLPLCYVTVADRATRATWYDTYPHKMKEYYIETTLIAPSNKNETVNLADMQAFRQSVSRAICGNLASITISGSQIFDSIEEPDPTIVRPDWLNDYDVSPMHFKFYVIEPGE